MAERIIVDFDDEKDSGKAEKAREENRIVIDFDEEIIKADSEGTEKRVEEIIPDKKINSGFRGNLHINNSYYTELKFPEGIENGFRLKFGINLKDEFFNAILENNIYIILSSRNGNVYLIDRQTGVLKEKIFLENESFEKTGLVYENNIYLNSLKKIFLFDEGSELKFKEIYNSTPDYFIWSNLNRHKETLIFTEFSPVNHSAILKAIDLKNQEIIFEHRFDVKDFVSDVICIAEGTAFILYDSFILIYDADKNFSEEHSLEIKTDENSFIFYLNYRVYITTHLNELYYLDLPPVNYKFRFSGIKNNYINSIGGFADNIFIGALDGWKYYKSSGLPVYSFDDEYENKIEAISKNVIVVSQKNKIVFCNLNRFQEAEGYVISSKGNEEESVEIISSVISGNEIFILTKNGTLEVFTNDKLNIHL